MSGICIDCGTTFDLLNEQDTKQLQNGHTCPAKYTIYDLPFYSMPSHVEETT